MLLQTLATWPVDTSPHRTMFLPIRASSGLAFSNADSDAPTMNVSVAFSAPAVPPETGASMSTCPCAPIASETCLATGGAIVLASMQNLAPVPEAPAAIPFSPRYTF
eukprot:Amastigsp_a843652_91.p4 type:complete len:107 gc:universal Amastigsp_a843652_91:400-720(+)